MNSVLAQMALPILVGVAWRIIRPGGLDADAARRVVTTLVFNFLLPALFVSVLWQVKLGEEALRVALFGAAVIVAGAVLAWMVFAWLPVSARLKGAAILGVAFPNVTFLGLPVLEQTFGPWARTIVIEIDLFATTPLVLTLGVAIARRFGHEDEADRPANPVVALLLNPPMLAALAAVGLNLSGWPPPAWLAAGLERMAAAVIPLMLVALGMALGFDRGCFRRDAPFTLLAMAMKLLTLPALAWPIGTRLGFDGDRLTALVMEAAMPCMLLGVVYCDRWQLDTRFYSTLVTLTTLAAALSLPFWHGIVSGA